RRHRRFVVPSGVEESLAFKVGLSPDHKPRTVDEIVAWEGRAPSRPIIWDDKDIVLPRGLFTYGVGLTAGTSFFCEPGATLAVIGAAASSAAALSFVRGPASIFVALIP